MGKYQKNQPGRQSGQAAVEAALTLPLTIFLILGTLQLFMMLQGRIMAEYAAFAAVRAGSRQHGDCKPMVHAALAGLLPSVISFTGGSGGGSAAQKMAEAWKKRIGSPSNPDPKYQDGKHNGPVFWLVRESPKPGDFQGKEDLTFDTPEGDGSDAMRLEVRLVYWYRLRIPFADWVMSRMFLAHLGLKNYNAANPLILTQTQAGWTKSEKRTVDLESSIRQELSSRVNSGQYVFPIHATYGMRMMTPARRTYFQQQNCASAPEGL
ncbi:TadE/TadG family type IV pilus assembly protein [Melittangium boletus]|uniref:TadE-like domain-containing protein n=1 Tax=Melittangium boletus DSM 14713 TaxID=1294270 RepID=A0A250ILC1_9BACT|nr:TadE family protein [Melittangium boletus]ATB31967.1 hypothetical protein MEBOL_005439 [Melittangium boletus DSM 14713]